MQANRILGVVGAAVAIVAMTALPSDVSAQGCVWDGCLADNPFSPDYVPVPLDNGQLLIFIGRSGTVHWGNDGDPTDDDNANEPELGCLDTTVNVPGRWSFGYSAGSPVSALDNNCAFTFGWPHPGGFFGYGTIRVVDGTTTTDAIYGDSGGSWAILPFQGLSGTYVRSEWQTATSVYVVCRVDELGDTWRFRWEFYNLNDHTVQVGLRTGQWTAPKQDDGSPWGDERGYFGLSPYVLLPGSRPKQTDFAINRNSVGTEAFPPYFDTYFSQSDPYPSLRQWLKRSNNYPDMTNADAMVWASWERLLDGILWDGGLIPDHPVALPSYAAYYNPVSVRPFVPGDYDPDESKARPGLKIIQYVSSSNSSTDLSSISDGSVPIVLTTETNRVLQFNASGQNNLSPNPFVIYAAVTNGYSILDKEVDVQNVTAALSLPPGMSLAPGETVQKNISRIGPGQTGRVQWNVVANGETNGNLTYRVLVSAPPANAKQVANTIVVSPTNKYKSTDGFELVAFPWSFLDPRFSAVFGVSGLRTIAIDTATGRYVPADSVARGVGYWVDTGENATFTLNGATAPSGQTTNNYSVTLQPGWNLIGNPWLYPVPLGQIVFINLGAPEKAYSMAEAIELGLIKGVFYYYDKALAEYQFTQDLTTPVDPGKGYWIRVTGTTPVQMVWPPVFQVGVGGTPRGPDHSWDVRPDHYRLQIAARSKNGVDTQTYFGVTQDAKTGPDKWDLPKPPQAPEGKMFVSINRTDWGDQSGAYAQDVRASSDTNPSWEFTVTAAQEGDVTLTWPNLSQLPSDVGFRLTDLQSGITRNLRNVSAYTFSATAGTRTFKLEKVAATASKVVITGLNLNTTRGGVSVQYALSVDATTTVRVLNAKGQVVQVVAQNKAETRGVQTHNWNGKDVAGISMPPGTYIMEIAAVTTDGQVARVVRPHILTR